MRRFASLFRGTSGGGFPLAFAKATAVCSDPEELIIQHIASGLRRIYLLGTRVNKTYDRSTSHLNKAPNTKKPTTNRFCRGSVVHSRVLVWPGIVYEGGGQARE